MAELQQTLNTLAGTTGLDAQGAANVWAGTTGKDLVSALNIKNGTVGKDLQGVLNALAGTTGKGVNGAASSLLVRNLLPANAASGGDTLGDTTGLTTGGVTLARSTLFAAQGTGSIAATVTVATAWALYSPTVVGLSAVPVTPGSTYTASAFVRSTSASVSNVSVRIRWFTSAGSVISDSPVTYTVNNAAWTYMLSTAVAPATAGYGAFVFGAPTNNQGEIFYLDCLGLWQGVGGTWALPGQIILGVNANI